MFNFYRPEGEGNDPLVFPTDWLMSQSAHICLCTGGSKGESEGCEPPGPNSFNFMQFIGKIWQNLMLAPPPRGNTGSATALLRRCFSSK